MAEVRRCVGRRTCDFAHKICNKHYRVETQCKPGKAALRASSLSAGLLLGDIKDGGRCGDGYTRVTPPLSAGNNGFNDYNYYFPLDKECLISNETQIKNIGLNLARCRSYVKFKRALAGQQSPGTRRLFWGQVMLIRAYTGTRPEPLYKTKTGYYDVLEVTPSATQAQIKTAYYKQSFVYHPDRNAGSEAATVRFSEISEAYTVLGNKALRKRYDRGMLSQADLTSSGPSSSRGGSTKQQQQQPPERSRRSMMGADTRGGVFDFDSFYKEHYSEQLQREKDTRVRREEMIGKKRGGVMEEKKMITMVLGVMLVTAAALLISLKRS